MMNQDPRNEQQGGYRYTDEQQRNLANITGRSQPTGIGGQQAEATMSVEQTNRFRSIMSRVFVWMFAGLVISGVVGVLIATTPLSHALLQPMVLMILLITQLVVVLVLSHSLRKVRPNVARALFIAYSALTGVTIAVLLLSYELSSVIYSLFGAGVVFGVMALWGARTQRDLSGIGTVGRMLLIGAILMSLVNMVLFFVMPGAFQIIDAVLNYVILAIFVGLTAYDMQRIRAMAMNPEMIEAYDPANQSTGSYNSMTAAATATRADDTIAIYGALMLYLDFINIFIRILRIFGRRR